MAQQTQTEKLENTLAHPIFDEPVFNEIKPLLDPDTFSTRHPTDNAQYAAIEELLKKRS